MIAGGTKGGMRKPFGKDTCLLILHAGGEDGWFEEVESVFRNQKCTCDYHDEMNAERSANF